MESRSFLQQMADDLGDSLRWRTGLGPALMALLLSGSMMWLAQEHRAPSTAELSSLHAQSLLSEQIMRSLTVSQLPLDRSDQQTQQHELEAMRTRLVGLASTPAVSSFAAHVPQGSRPNFPQLRVLEREEQQALQDLETRSNSLLERERQDQARLASDTLLVLGFGLFLLAVQFGWLLWPLRAKLARFVDRALHSNRELRATLTAVEQNTQSRSRFLAGMSHEIRTPLNGIVGFSDFLLSSTLDRQQQEYAQTIQLCSKHLLSILDGLMDFSRLELSKLKLDVEPTNAMEVVEEALQMLAPMAYGKGLELWNLADPALDKVYLLDAQRLRQVLVNLVTNAVKFTPTGNVRVEASVSHDEQNRVTLEFRVCDTGPGIPRDVQTQLFEPFRQMDVSVTRRYGGSGLGLAISKGLVELMEGKIGCMSDVGRGSTFFFAIVVEPSNVVIPQRLKTSRLQITNCPQTLQASLERWCAYWGVEVTSEGLPLIFSDSPPARGIWACPLSPSQNSSTLLRLPQPYRWTTLRHLLEEAPAPAPEPAQAYSIVGLEILVVEDNSVNRKVLCTMLDKMGAIVESAENGKLALEILEKKMYPVIFMDLAMPVMDGYEATRRIRQTYADGPWIIACTAQATSEDRERSFQVGMNDFIAKPLQKEKLLQSLSLRPSTPPVETTT